MAVASATENCASALPAPGKNVAQVVVAVMVTGVVGSVAAVAVVIVTGVVVVADLAAIRPALLPMSFESISTHRLRFTQIHP
jgi:hypothetical protein